MSVQAVMQELGRAAVAACAVLAQAGTEPRAGWVDTLRERGIARRLAAAGERDLPPHRQYRKRCGFQAP